MSQLSSSEDDNIVGFMEEVSGFLLEKMAANLPRPSTDENISTTLSSGITDVSASMDVGDASKIVSPCYLVIDRVDSAGELKSASLWEYVKVTNVASNTLTITRAQGGSTAQSHSPGAVVEAVATSSMFEDWYAALNPEHDASGGHVITGTMTIAGMNLASVATIAKASIGHLNVSGSSVSGFERTFVWYMAGYASGASTNVMRLTAPFSGTFRAFSVTPRTPVSGASLTLAVYTIGAGTSIFDTVTRPSILGGGTYASTASIKNPNFIKGQTLRVDIETGGNVADILVEGISY